MIRTVFSFRDIVVPPIRGVFFAFACGLHAQHVAKKESGEEGKGRRKMMPFSPHAKVRGGRKKGKKQCRNINFQFSSLAEVANLGK